MMTSNGNGGHVGLLYPGTLNLLQSSSSDQQETSGCGIKIVMFPEVPKSLHELKIIHILTFLESQDATKLVWT